MTFNLDIGQVISEMVKASDNSFKGGGNQAKEYAAHEYTQFIHNLEHIQTMAEEKIIKDEEVQPLVDMHKHSMQAVMLCIKGLGLINVQNGINAALKVLWAALSAAVSGLKFTL